MCRFYYEQMVMDIGPQKKIGDGDDINRNGEGRIVVQR